nr:alpha/beta hydrolase [Bacillus sp. J14TS2]
MTIIKKETLQVAGANIYYEMHGSGPILLLIHGGGGDADKFHHVVADLADRYTVVTYDRRGHSRSSFTNGTEDYNVETHSDDAHLLLAKLTDEPAYVFGSSSGAVIGLDLCIRHPEQIQVLVPHEPILLQLLDGNELKQAELFMEELKKNHRSQVIKLLSNLQTDDLKPGQSMDMLTELLLSNSTYFTEHEIPGILNYTLNINRIKTVLASASIQMVPAGGTASREFFPYRCAVALAEQLGIEIVEFPGDHGGYNSTTHKEFANQLHNVLVNGIPH